MSTNTPKYSLHDALCTTLDVDSQSVTFFFNEVCDNQFPNDVFKAKATVYANPCYVRVYLSKKRVCCGSVKYHTKLLSLDDLKKLFSKGWTFSMFYTFTGSCPTLLWQGELKRKKRSCSFDVVIEFSLDQYEPTCDIKFWRENK